MVASYYDHSLLQFDLQTSKLLSDPLNTDSVVIELCWQPKYQQRLEHESILVAACSNGSLVYFTNSIMGQNISLRVKRKVNAHQGSVTTAKWSSDGSNFASSGEDGEVKIWSQAGHLKSVISRFNSRVNCLGWSYDNNAVIAAHCDVLTILPFHNQDRKDTIEWRVAIEEEDCIILAVDWENALDLVVCGGEDCRYRVFDSTGLCLFVSPQMLYPVTKATWIPNGEAFAIGSFDTLYLCDKEGLDVTHYRFERNTCILDIHYVSSSSKIVAGSSNGDFVLADIVGKRLEWDGFAVERTAGDTLYLNSLKSNDCSQIIPTPE